VAHQHETVIISYTDELYVHFFLISPHPSTVIKFNDLVNEDLQGHLEKKHSQQLKQQEDHPAPPAVKRSRRIRTIMRQQSSNEAD
jgi:hypothetical protein